MNRAVCSSLGNDMDLSNFCSAAIFDPALYATASTWQWLSLDFVLHCTLFVLVCYHCLETRREASSALLWMFMAWSFPVIGPILFLAVGVNRAEAKAWRTHKAGRKLRAESERDDAKLPMAYWRAVRESIAPDPTDNSLFEVNRVLNGILPDYPLLDGNLIQPLVNGDAAFPAMIEAIEKARHHVHLQTFIIKHDAVGRRFMELLAEKAREGVAVRFMFDRFGSTTAMLMRLFSRYGKTPNLRISGWTQVNALKRRFQINLRNHRKILVVDGTEAFTGGVNLHIENVSQNGIPAIRDYHFRIRGPLVQELQYSFLNDWYFMTNEDPETLLQQAHFPALRAAGNAMARIANGGPTAEEMEVTSDCFFQSIVSAKRQILAVTPYFVPTRDIIHAFRLAALKGVDVRLIVPQRNNHPYAGFAGQALYEELLAAGVRIFERHPPFMHAKALLVDDSLALVGSANMDVRSLRLNYETSLIVFDDLFANALKKIIIEDIENSTEIFLSNWQRRGRARRLLENCCSLFTPML